MEMRILLMILLVPAIVACSRESTEEMSSSAAAEPAEATVADPAPSVAEAQSELAGTAWRLLNISEMDDSTHLPDDPSKYTLVLNTDGAASLRADCNRGSGSWNSESPGQLGFGPIAATRALCPPGSLSDTYLAQFEWVRSYVKKDDNLYLATMADGAIIEFEPLPPVVATVFGEEIRAAEPAEMQAAVLDRVFDRYAVGHDLAAEESEVDAFVESMERGMAEQGLTAADELSPEEAAQVDAMRREMGRSMIRQWKINRSLYEAYGGRVIYQQLGPEPLDAYRAHLEALRDTGELAIEDASMADYFWGYFTDDSKHDFMEPGSTEEAAAFAHAPWEGEP